MLVLIILAVVWAAVLVPPFLRSRRDGRPGSSVVMFRAQLSTLERATPGSSFRQTDTGSVRAVAPTVGLVGREAVRRRRRDVLVGLAGATAFTLLLAIAFGGFAIVMFLACAGALGTYVYALRQIQLRALERSVKVHTLVPRTAAAPAPVLALRRSASS